ncbi:probable NADH dehydrogenase [ubiquinone] 1 alpha subcomplex subunit 12 [Diaphorina citri]|uniref:NADH dehydrogenase [ubiquinone] 1 alpha subcomplex subunit 12 n=1 Tax=Diaphorina citri TaxID=121845 RepID=A0A1S3DTE6_DIACI|nr:probable NADH dehydrogenase [ubiquinone] 1 alpha subcomplex subunit 12 [Diaphorina citri]
MAKLLGLDKLAHLMQAIKQNGGILGSAKILLSLVPAEWYGWLHYKTDYLPHEKPKLHNEPMFSESLFTISGSLVPAEWYGWLHYKTDYLPHEDPGRPKYKWMAEHTENFSGSNKQYVPYSSTRTKIEAWKPK